MRPKTLQTVALLALLAMTWGEFAWHIAWPSATQHLWHRPAAWVAARLALEGHSDLIYAGGKTFGDESARLGAVPDIFEANAPTTILPYLPLARLPIDTARTLWVSLSLACFLAAWLSLLKALHMPLRLALALSALVPLYQPLRNNIYLGQAYTAGLLLSVAGSIMAIRTAFPSRASSGKRGLAEALAAGCAFALLCIVRQYYGLVQLLTPFVRRQWLLLGVALGFYGLAVALTFPLLGPEVWGKSLELSLSWRERPETAVTAYQSLNNFLTHLFSYHPTLNPGPLVNMPRLVGPLWSALALAVLSASVWALWCSRHLSGRAGSPRLLAYALPLPVAMLLAPISEDYHYTLLLFPLPAVAVALRERSKHRPLAWSAVPAWSVYVLIAVLLGAPWHFYNVPGTEGWHALLYYPRLYGNLLLWGLVLWGLKVEG